MKKNNNHFKRVFIAWKSECTRSENIAKHFHAKNIFIFPIKASKGIGPLLLRYFISVFSTIIILIREKPKIIFTLNQPPLLITIVNIYSKIFGAKYILDSHSGAFNDRRWRWFRNVYKLIAKKAYFNINTCFYHKDLVENWGGRSFIIGDVPIDFSKDYQLKKLPFHSIAFVSSFMFDEPIGAVWEAAKLMRDVSIYVTGNYLKLPKTYLDNVPVNIKLQGYIPIDEYFSLIKSVTAVMVLTTRSNTMQRGGYEALSLEQPIITSDWDILRESFGDGAIYIDNTAQSIASAVQELFANYDKYKNAIIAQRKKRKEFFIKTKKEIEDCLNNI